MKQKAKASITSEGNLPKASKNEENEAINRLKNTQESMKGFLRGYHEEKREEMLDTLYSKGFPEYYEVVTIEFEERALDLVTQLIEDESITLSEESVGGLYDTVVTTQAECIGKLEECGVVWFDIPFEKIVVKGVLYNDEESRIRGVMSAY